MMSTEKTGAAPGLHCFPGFCVLSQGSEFFGHFFPGVEEVQVSSAAVLS